MYEKYPTMSIVHMFTRLHVYMSTRLLFTIKCSHPVNIDPSGQYWHDAANRHLTALAQYWPCNFLSAGGNMAPITFTDM